MDRNSYRANNIQQTLAQDFPQANSTDTVVVSIRNVDAGTLDVNQVAMTYVAGTLWKYTGWTPALANLFEIDYYNQSQDVHNFEYALVSGSPSVQPSGGLGASTLTTLRTKFLKLIDNFNSTDLTGTNSSGEIADLCINNALQLIYSQLKATRFIEQYPTTALVSTSGQSYIELSAVTDLDELTGLRDTVNEITLIGITKEQYFREVANPANSTGTPWRFCRIFNRIYLDPQPTSAITYTLDYLKIYPQLVSDSDAALIPSKFDPWIYAESKVQWAIMEDSKNVPEILVTERADARDIYLADALSNTHIVSQSQSYFSKARGPVSNPYDHV